MNLYDVLLEVADELDPLPERIDLPEGGAEWSRGDVLFASVEGPGDAAAFRLDTDLAEAARRTPDTATTALGNEWVVFGPGTIDQHAIDRARAWFEAAYRRATPS
jgi:hypothetical protein